MQYKTGDVVLLKVKIETVDEHDPYLSYHGHPGLWFRDADVIAICPSEPDPEPEPEPEYKFEVGDWVSALGKTGQIIENDHGPIWPYLIRYTDGSTSWENEGMLTHAEEPKPEPKFKVGDKVIHIHKPEWGVGTIKNLNPWGTDIDYTDRTENTPEVHSTQFYQVEYPHKYIDAGWPCSGSWATAEENLTPA